MNIQGAINGEFIYSKNTNQTFTYVIDMNDDIIIAKRNGNGRTGKATPHPTLIGGVNPRVKMAGLINISNGKIVSFNHMSGHFKPNIRSMKEAEKAFGKLPRYLFKGGKKG